MEIRVLPKQDVEKAIALWQYCFQDPEAFTRWFFANRAEEVLIAGQDDIATMAVTAPVRFSARGEARKGYMVSGIATAPEHRGRGFMREFMPRIHEHMVERGAAMAGLYPFDYGFYEKFGWAICSDCLCVRLPLKRLPAARLSGEFSIHSLLPAAEGDLAQIYQQCFSKRSGHVLRDAAFFTLRLEELRLDDGFAALYRRGGALEGYLLYRFEGKTIVVEEFGALTHQARADILTFLAGHSSSMEEASWLSPPDDPMWRMIPDARGAATIEPYSMLRILDVANTLNGLPCGEGELILEVLDPHAAWNVGNWLLKGVQGRLMVERTAKQAAASISINQLTQWVVGYHSAGELRDMGAISSAVASQMDALLPPCRAFLFEMY